MALHEPKMFLKNNVFMKAQMQISANGHYINTVNKKHRRQIASS